MFSDLPAAHVATSVTIRSLALLTTLTGCATNTSDATSDAGHEAPPTRVFRDDALGLAFELPVSWSHSERDGRHLFAGPEGDATFFTTVSLQKIDASLRSTTCLPEALDDAYRPVRGHPHFGWERREPASVGGRPALRYGLGFELHETQRRKSGVLLDTGRHLVDISYGAPAELFFAGLPAFDEIIESLSVY